MDVCLCVILIFDSLYYMDQSCLWHTRRHSRDLRPHNFMFWDNYDIAQVFLTHLWRARVSDGSCRHQAHCAGSFHPCVAFSACFCSLFHYANWYLLYFILAYLFVNVALMYFPHSLLSLSLRFSMFSVGLTVLMLNIVISGLRRLPQHTHSNSN